MLSVRGLERGPPGPRGLCISLIPPERTGFYDRRAWRTAFLLGLERGPPGPRAFRPVARASRPARLIYVFTASSTFQIPAYWPSWLSRSLHFSWRAGRPAFLSAWSAGLQARAAYVSVSSCRKEHAFMTGGAGGPPSFWPVAQASRPAAYVPVSSRRKEQAFLAGGPGGPHSF